MSSQSPLTSPAKRPTLSDRPPSTNSLSSSAKQKGHKHYAVGASGLHTRNTSYGRALAKAGQINSAQNVPEDGIRHHRKKSSTSMASTSPKRPTVKRNSSHVALAKNTSAANLRKNKSANAIARNLSHTQLHRKPGIAPSALRPRKKMAEKNKGFELGDKSSDEEADEEAEWEDSTTQSPELTRNNSIVARQPTRTKTSAEVTPGTPSRRSSRNGRTSSPPEPSLRHNRSVPNFGARESSASPVRPPEPPTNLAQLQHNPRSSRAPPAISSISAQASRDPLPRNNSSFTHINHSDAISSQNTSHLLSTPNTGKSAGASSSADGGVSHFLSARPTSTPNHQRHASSGSDYDSPSSFLPHYQPQQCSSPEKSRVLSSNRTHSSTNLAPKSTHHRSTAHLPSRTQQRLELQRRETMRASAPTPPSTPLLASGPRGASAVSLHSRSGSHGRNRGSDPASANAARLMVKQDYEAAERQLAVVRRFKNPVVEAVVRLKDVAGLGLNLGETEGGGNAGREGKKAGKRRSGLGIVKPESNLKSAGGNTTRTRMLAEDSTDAQHDLSSDPSRSPSRGRSVRSTGKVHFRRQGSHDDIGLSRSQGSHDGPEEEGTLGEIEGGASAEEEIMRRMWESREVYDKGDEVGVGEGR